MRRCHGFFEKAAPIQLGAKPFGSRDGGPDSSVRAAAGAP